MLYKSIICVVMCLIASILLISGCTGGGDGDDVTYALNVTITGEGEVYVNDDEDPYTDTQEYPADETVLLVATTEEEGYEFVRWEGDETSINSRLLINMNEAKNVTAVFEATKYELTINTEGLGTVTPESGEYSSIEPIILTATPDTGFKFDRWTGGLVSTDNPAELTLTSDKTVTAVFVEEEAEYTLSITTTGLGSVTPSDGTYDYGTLLDFVAAPGDGWHFLRWGGDFVLTSNTETNQLVLDGDKSITASFEADAAYYNLSVSTTGSGSVDNPGGSYAADATVTLIATPDEDDGDTSYHFVRWEGDVTGTDATIIVTMDRSKDVTAVFDTDEDDYALSVQTVGEGSVSITALSILPAGTVQAITATAEEGSYFYQWSGDLPSTITKTDKTISITMNADTEIYAIFKPNPQVLIETTLGDITVELNKDKAPITVANFLAYVESGFYDGTDGNGQTIFHRVISGFMDQAGGLTDALVAKTTNDPIINESNNGLLNDIYTIAMARTSDPDSATSQFFINAVDNPSLDYQSEASPGYAVFGVVVDGSSVVDAINAVTTETRDGYDDVPVDNIYITGTSIVTP